MSRSRNWVFTWNNPQPEGGPNISTVADQAKYVVYQLEKGENGTPHFQGLIVFSTVKSLKQLKNMLPAAHFEVMRGSLEQAEKYCTKEDTRIMGPWKFGEKPQQGRRTDLEQLRLAIQDGATELEIADNFFGSYLRFRSSINRYRLLSARTVRSEHTEALVYWGPTESGKTRHALELAGDNAFWMPKPPPGATAWWDGYDGQATVVLDEFYGWLPLDMLLRLIDRYPYQVATRGAAVAFISKRIIITSNKPPAMWFPRIGHGVCPPSLARRLTPPFGYVFYVGTDEYPTEESYLATLDAPVDDGHAAFAGGYRR